MKSHSDYVKDFDRAWDDPATIAEKCWQTNAHNEHLWRRVRTNDYPDVDESMRKCKGVIKNEVKPSSHFHIEGDDSQDLG